jgi:hypothetical protein
MKTLLCCAAIWVSAASAASIPAGWITIKDASTACQAGVPADFKPQPGLTSLAQGPGNMIAIHLISQAGKTLKPLDAPSQKALMIGKMFDNTANRVFYSMEPAKKDGTVLAEWRVTVPGKGGVCFAQITLLKGASEDLARKIADTLGPIK